MKVLIIAIACSPYAPSESYVGWAVACAVAKDHDVWVLTHGRYREDLKRAASEGKVPPRVKFHFAGEPFPWAGNRLKARVQSWMEFMHWMKRLLLPAAQDLHAQFQFDLIHHVTYTTWRVPSPLWTMPVPFIWGPIGGGEIFPLRFMPMLSAATILFELARCASSARSMLSNSVRRCARGATQVVAANRMTRSLIEKLRGKSDGIVMLSGSFFDQARVDRFSTPIGAGRLPSGALKFFAGGNLEGRKGVAIALEALAILRKNSSPWTYRLGGGGPESMHLQALSAKLGIADRVVFGESLSSQEYVAELQSTHVYLLPSLRDNAPLTLMEAMLGGCVPVVADTGGPGEIVTEECGFRIAVTSPARMAHEISVVLQRLDQDRPLLKKMSEAATRRIAEHYTEAHYREVINRCYRQVAGTG